MASNSIGRNLVRVSCRFVAPKNYNPRNEPRKGYLCLILNLSGNLEFFRLSASPLRAGHIERERLLNELSHRVAALACRYVARTIQRHTDRIRKQWRCRRDDSYGSILDAPKSIDDEFGYDHSGNV